MQHQIFKQKTKRSLLTLFIAIFTVVLSFTIPQTTYAIEGVDCTLPTGDSPPGPIQILCPLIRVVNFLVLSAGAVFVLMIIIAAYKYYFSLGDPKTNAAARETLIKAVFGFIVVISTMLILTLIVNVTGATGGATGINPLQPFEAAKDGLCNLLVCSDNGSPIVGGLEDTCGTCPANVN